MEKFKQFFSKLSKRERVIFYATGLILFLGIMDRLVYEPVVNLFNELDQEILMQENRLRKNLKYLAIRESVQNRYSAYAANAVTSGFDEEEVASLLNEIEGMARNSGLALVNMKPKPIVATDLGKFYPVEVEVETNMIQLMKFIHGLHSSKFILGVKKFNLVPKGKKSKQVKGYLLIHKTVIH